jgi:indole-3-glycerol phosphate synthase
MSSTSQRSILSGIVDYKREVEIPRALQMVSMAEMRRRAESADYQSVDFAAALDRKDECIALIAEVKRASPSRGLLVKGEFHPAALASTYEANGASAISVLTDENYFQGSIEYLIQVKKRVSVPVLRKDFVVSSYQLYEARASGADAVLLIVAVLDDAQLSDFYQLAASLKLTALVEVHDQGETERALRIGAKVIGVNNRNLHTFETKLSTTAECAEIIGRQALIVSESGIFNRDNVLQVAAMGASAVLVGESIITSDDIARQVRELSSIGGKP